MLVWHGVNSREHKDARIKVCQPEYAIKLPRKNIKTEIEIRKEKKIYNYLSTGLILKIQKIHHQRIIPKEWKTIPRIQIHQQGIFFKDTEPKDKNLYLSHWIHKGDKEKR